MKPTATKTLKARFLQAS